MLFKITLTNNKCYIYFVCMHTYIYILLFFLSSYRIINLLKQQMYPFQIQYAFPQVVEIGAIEGGIAAAQWSPDQSALVIATNNDTIICMNAQWDVLYEVPVSERLPQSPCTISWSGDGETFCLLSVDKGPTDTGLCTVRVFNRELILTATCCNVATDAAGAVMKGLGNTAAFATNGSCIAIPQQRVKSKTQVRSPFASR